MQATRVVLSLGHQHPVPRPATLFVSVELGHAFRALPLDEQRRMIEAGLTDALAEAYAKLDEANAPADEVAAA